MILKIGSRGADVARLQRELVKAGHKLVVDGDYGEATAKAVADYQRKHGLVVDGIYGPKTAQKMAGTQCCKKLLTQQHLQAAAERLNVPVAAIMAISSVESAGTGFDNHGRPRILFERHIFRRQLAKAGVPEAEIKALESKQQNLVSKSPGGYQGGSLEHQRLTMAKRIHPDAALESASWGLYQIMGFHWESLGYASATEFAARMEQNEGEHLEAFVRFIEADKALLKALQGLKWADFAKRYNGPAYAQNLYDVKMARAYEQFSQLHPEPEKASA